MVVIHFGPFPDADTYIAEAASKTNYSGEHDLRVSNTSGGRQRALVTIRLQRLIGAGRLESAVLHLYMASSAAASEPLTVHRVIARWDPSSTTWESASGGRFDPDEAASIDAESVGWKELDITPLVLEWLAESSQNYGIILTAPSASVDTVATFHSSNHPDPLLRPWLEAILITDSE